MIRRTAALMVGLFFVLGGIGALPRAVAQSQSLEDRLVGEWSLVSVYNVLANGNKIEPNGATPKGIFIFTRTGRFSALLLNSDIPKFASNNRQKGSPEEFKAVAQGVLSYFGSYTAGRDPNTIELHVAYSSFPNMNGTNGVREVKIEGDQLYLITTAAPSGGTAYTTWKRL